MVLVTHEEDIAEHCQRIIRLRDGEIVSDLPVTDRRMAWRGKMALTPGPPLPILGEGESEFLSLYKISDFQIFILTQDWGLGAPELGEGGVKRRVRAAAPRKALL